MGEYKRVGILGGGQLAMMLCEAASRLGVSSKVLAPDANCPAKRTADMAVQADYEDLQAVQEFAADCDVVTFEFENVPVRSLFSLQEANHIVAPGAKILAIVQDRLTEKQFLQDNQIPLARFARIDKVSDLGPAMEAVGLPAVLKTRHFGYDGKGQTWIHEEKKAEAAFDLIHHHPAVLEEVVPFVREVSVIAACNYKGEFVAFPVTENVHESGILRQSSIPANCSAEVAETAIVITRKIIDTLGYIGVLAVEFFETANGELLVNEIAPRVHNSGHWTRGGACPDQFEMHIRAVLAMDMPQPKCASYAKMQNLIGADILQAEALQNTGWQVCDYGKSEKQPGRKMGHAVKWQ